MFVRFRYFLEGATPDELKQLTAQQLQNTKLLRTKLSRLQVRSTIITPSPIYGSILRLSQLQD